MNPKKARMRDERVFKFLPVHCDSTDTRTSWLDNLQVRALEKEFGRIYFFIITATLRIIRVQHTYSLV